MKVKSIFCSMQQNQSNYKNETVINQSVMQNSSWWDIHIPTYKYSIPNTNRFFNMWGKCWAIL